MSLLRDHKDPTGCSFQDHQSKMKNNNKQALFAPDGDANANQIQESDRVTKCGSKTVDHGSVPPLLSQRDEQDKVIIWGTHSQCDDPDLEEFEMLECMELEAYLTEGQHGTETVTEVRSGSCLNGKSGPCDSEQDEPRTGKGMDRNGEEEKASPWNVADHDSTWPQSLGDKGRTVCVTTTESSSENDIFLSCMSTMSVIGGSFASAQDSSGEGHALELQHILSEPHKTISEDVSLVSQSLPVVPVKATGLDKPDSSFPEASSLCVDVNLNSAVLSQECNPQTETGTQETCCSEDRALLEECMQHPKDTQSFQVNLHQRNFDGTDEHLDGSTNKQEAGLSSVKDCNENVAFSQDPLSSCCSNEDQPKMGPLSDPRTSLHNTSQKVKERLSREEVIFEGNKNQPKAPLGGTASQPSAVEPRALRKQGSFEHGRSTSPSLEKKAALARRPWGSPTRPTTPPSAKPAGSPRRRLPASPVKCARAVVQERSEAPPGPACHLKTSIKACPSSGILKPVLQHSTKPEEKTEPESWTSPPLSHTQKPKNVRPKIITSVRRSPTAKPHVSEVPYEVSTLPPRLSGHIPNLPNREPKTGGPGRALFSPSATSPHHDKHHPEVQKGCSYSPELVVSGIRPPSDVTPPRLSGKSESFCEELTDKHLHERGQDASSLESPGYEDSVLSRHRAAGVLCSPRALRPQLGLGAVTRLPYARNRMLFTSQRSPLPLPHPARAASPPAHCYQETAGDQRKLSADAPPRSLLPQPGYTGLRLPGYTRLPTARLATFGFVRSASVSSVPSYQSVEGSYGDHSRPTHRLNSSSDDPSLQRVSGPPIEVHPQASGRSSPHPPGAPGTTRRSLLPPPRSSPLSTRKEIQKETGAVRPVASSPKRLSTVSPKPQSPVHSRQRPAVAVVGGARVGPLGDSPRRGRPDGERQLVEQLRGRCEEQERQLQGLQAELARATLGLDAFAISTQHFCLKSENAIERQRDLSLELSRIRDEAAFNAARWERLQSDKEELERSFERELQGLRSQQRAELRALEEGLTAQHVAERDRMCAECKAERDELQAQQQDRIEEMSTSCEATLSKMENAHLVTLGRLQEQHARTVEELKETHEQERRLLEQEFEKHRLLLQDQVDTLTFQNRSLRDRAKRFEEALRKSTDEQIVDALAPYQHIKEDLKSLKEVLEMKNQQIHKQELKISELEKMAQKNVVLEERVQVLQQQNEDLKARIDRNLAMSRQLSEENANLQVYVEKESNEKKRLSRTNEELLWRLQTGELSPRMLSPSSSPIHRASPGPGSPARFQPLPR